ncbi:glutaredoxin 3 [Tistlia consotensis]|uniref:Glutaredoxin n=1 Tax=Tistlia consotensis USBA 355 TaxID=560819 RepID=A0A1Y6BX17_9PROT|nr:glutaredoxin 3 [Tistlia consotensis]SMF33663.1 glutaredoxin 3 [Tistlia consotensis USBA 355]SNR70077.1 glutaredoxin 3 [Tistlia consotensis]
MPKVEVYSSAFCPFCYRAKKLLSSKGVQFEEIDVMMNPSRKAEMVQRAGGRTSVPQVFVDDQYLGDCDGLYALEARGELDARLAGAAAQ